MDSKPDLNNFPDWEQIACPTCKSPFHEEKDCPQSKVTGESKFRFRTRKEMGIEPDSLPFKFRVDIDPQSDDEVEIVRKRALLRLNSSKVYNLMGLSVRARESQKSALQWIIQMAEELNIDDEQLQEERNSLLPIIQVLQESLHKLTKISQTKIKQAEAMEEVAEKARNHARKVRNRLSRKKSNNKEFGVLILHDSSVSTPLVYGEEDPASLIKEAADAIIEKEKSKHHEEEEEEN